jgi:hypothetical protein
MMPLVATAASRPCAPYGLKPSAAVKFDREYTKAAQYGDLGVAFLTDPWGTYIEINEGLRAVR